MSKWSSVGLLLSLGAFVGLNFAEAADQPKYTIKEVMKEAHKNGLYKKVAEGNAEKAEKEKLVALY
jgi:hypothetical protein